MKRLFIYRKDLHLSPGRLAELVEHGAEAYWLNLLRQGVLTPDGHPSITSVIRMDGTIYEQYMGGLVTTSICEAQDKAHLLKARESALALGLSEGSDFGMICDHFVTDPQDDEAGTPTIVGIWFRPLPERTALIIRRKYQAYDPSDNTDRRFAWERYVDLSECVKMLKQKMDELAEVLCDKTMD